MQKKSYVNLFKEIKCNQASSMIEDTANNYYLDFHGKQIASDAITNISIESFENYKACYDNAVKNYTSFVSKLSTVALDNKHIRSFTCNGLPLFWLTKTSKKHYYHWLMKIFLLKNILSSGTCYFQKHKEITFFIPNHLKDVKKIIQELFNPHSIPVNFIEITTSVIPKPYFSLLKVSLKTIFLFFKMKKPELAYNIHSVIFLIAGTITDYTRSFFINIHIINNLEKDKIARIPLNMWINQSALLEYKVPYLFWKTRPQIITLIKIFYNQFKALHAIRGIDTNININIDDISYPIELIINEIENVIIYNSNYLIMSYWLNSFNAKQNKKTLFFYEDEFYPSGRALSFGLRGAKTHGIQHSMIVKKSSVYHISDIEYQSSNKNKNDGLPLPHRFIVWGDFFKKQFLSHNSLKNNFVIAAGNPTYINKSTKPLINNNKTFEILYCLTTQDFFSKEKYILKDILTSIPNLKLKIRFHPLWKFDNRIVLEFFTNVELTFSNETDIFNDINNSTIIITGSHSGVWLDAIVANKPVIRLVTSLQDEIEQTDLMYNATDSNELKNSIEFILKSKGNNFKNDLLYLQKDRWRELIDN
jgi:hypothetical protein